MDKTPSRTWRLNLVFGLLMLALVGLGVRMALLLRDSRVKASLLAMTQEQMRIELPGRVGSIFAHANTSPVQMAGSKQVPSCFIDLKEDVLREDEMGDVAIKVGQALNMNPIDVQNLFHARRGHRFVWIKRGIAPSEADAVRALKCRAIGIRGEWRREYANATLASTLIGWRMGDGLSGGGLELSQDRFLMPRDGYKLMRTDASRRPIGDEKTVVPEDGSNVYLTIDTNIQGWLEEAVSNSLEKCKAKWGVGVIANPNTGEILGMCSIYLDPQTKHPVLFDPDHFNSTCPETRNNYGVTVPYEPGSAAKAIFAAAAVNAGIVDWDTKIFCENGTWAVPNGGVVSDHGAHYGWLTVAEIIAQSSNVGMAKIGLKSGNAQLRTWAVEFGLGSKTGIELPGESSGILRKLRMWDTYSTPRVPFGQEISTTAIQLTMAYCALSNGGQLLRPHIVDRIVDSAGTVKYQWKKQVVRQAIKPTVSQGAISAMVDVVEAGTGKAARLTKWTSFGKTGTAQIPSPTPGQHGYADGAFTGTFVGGAPASNPQLVCLISIHWPRVGSHFGAVVAAPYWKEVMEKSLTYLNVPSDKAEEPARTDGRGRSHGD